MTPPAAQRDRRLNLPLLGYISLLALAASAIAVASEGLEAPAGTSAPILGLLPLGGLIVVAEYLFIRFRFAGETNAINPMEAVLAPLLFSFPPTTAIATVAASQVVAAVIRRNAPMKAAFNIAQWSLATGIGALVAVEVARSDREELSLILSVLVALVVVATVNQVAFTFVVTIANRDRLRNVLDALRPVMLRGWAASWTLNTAIGLLFVLAFDRHSVAALLFPVPLVVLHLAYRGYAGARTDRLRLTGVHRAVAVLAAPLDPSGAIATFLREVAESFDARAAVLALASSDAPAVHRVDCSTGDYVVRDDGPNAERLTEAVAAEGRAVRVSTAAAHPLRPFLLAEGARDALVAPLVQDGETVGALLVLDQGGIEGFEQGELAVFEALAREASGVFTRGALVATVLEERRATAEIIDSTSDGILTIDVDGVIRAWNPALEAITGVDANFAVGQPATFVLRPTTAGGTPVALDRWAEGVELPSDVEFVAADGSRRKVSCSYGSTSESSAKLVVIARDLSKAQEFEELRQELGRLEAAEAAHRAVVAALQDAVLPAPPVVDGAELAVSHVPSDERAPTGGDLYDWHVLPDGMVHVAVTDVLGHGVTATKHALAVISTLRLLALQGRPLERLVAEADVLLRAQDPELVATVVIVRYDPSSGRAWIAAGGHPPALVVSPNGSARQVSAPGSPIGWPEAGSDVVVEVDLRPGESLVLYTDGLVEARRNILEGLDALVEHACAVASRPATDLVTELVARALEGAERRDDSLALVIRRPVPSTSWTFVAELNVVADARRNVRSVLESRAVPVPVIDDLVLATSELVTNAIRSGASTVHVMLEVDDGRVVLDVSDDGAGDADLAGAGIELGPAAAESGRGLFLVRSLSDDVSILSTAEGTSVRLQRAFEVLLDQRERKATRPR